MQRAKEGSYYKQLRKCANYIHTAIKSPDQKEVTTEKLNFVVMMNYGFTEKQVKKILDTMEKAGQIKQNSKGEWT